MGTFKLPQIVGAFCPSVFLSSNLQFHVMAAAPASILDQDGGSHIVRIAAETEACVSEDRLELPSISVSYCLTPEFFNMSVKSSFSWVSHCNFACLKSAVSSQQVLTHSFCAH